MKRLILASASPRRSEIMKNMGLNFTVMPSDTIEDFTKLLGSPEGKVEKIAYEKVIDVQNKIDTGIIIGADTIVVLDGEIFGKPQDSEDAYTMLMKLSGRTHQVITGLVVFDAANGTSAIIHEKTEVVFSKLLPEQALWYINTKEPFGKAGAYAIQGIGGALVERISGCYFNVVGLPAYRLGKLLVDFGIMIFKE